MLFQVDQPIKSEKKYTPLMTLDFSHLIHKPEIALILRRARE
jgi:hypothetical protein